MAEPKRRTSKGRKRRRASHLALTAAHFVPCPQCRSPKLPHHVCPFCGTYNGRPVLAVERRRAP